MWQGLAQLRGWLNLNSRKRRRRTRRHKQSELFPTLQVRTLEERRVFHAGAIVAPVAGASTQPTPSPPPPSTTVTLDTGHNLLVQDMSANGRNDQLSIGFDKTSGNYVITDPTQPLVSEIEGAQGSGSHQLLIPVQAVSGDKVIVATGGGDDALTVNLMGGLAGKTLTFDGGSGQDSLTLVGGSYNTVGYAFLGDGTTQIQIGDGSNAAKVDLKNVEPVFDQLAAGVRQFSLDGAITEATLTGDVTSGGRQGTLTTSLGSSVTFVMPSTSLTLEAGEACQVQIVGQIDLGGGNLTIHGGAIEISSTITTHDATIDIASQSSLTMSASGILENEAGQTFLDAGDSGTLTVSGRIDVSAPLLGRGGTVRLLGQRVELQNSAVIDASGTAGGGAVLVGGDYQGLNPAIHNATSVLVSAGATIDANALEQGDGGTIIVWANDTAIVAGSANLHARGGPNGGNGGLIETSGKQDLEVGAAPDASASAGAAGTWLLDPINVTIVSSGGTGTLSGGVFTSDNTHNSINSAIIATALATMNVTINTGNGTSGNGDIFVNDAIHPTVVGSHTLTLNADRDIVLNDDIAAMGGSLSVVLNASRNVTFANGSITANKTTITAGGTVNSGNAASDISATGIGAAIFITADSLGTAVNPFQLSAGLLDVVSLTATLGGIYAQFDGDIATSQLMLDVAGNGQTISLASQFGSITFDNTGGFAPNTANDNFMLSTPTGGVLFGGAMLTAASVDIDSNLFIAHLGLPGVDIDTSALNGDITLKSDGLIGSLLSPLAIEAGRGQVSATTTGATGDIFLQSAGDLLLGAFEAQAPLAQTISITTTSGAIEIAAAWDTNDNVLLSANDDITFNSAASIKAAAATLISSTGTIRGSGGIGADLDTSTAGGPISLTGNAIGEVTTPLVINPGIGLVALDSATDVHLRIASGDFSFAQFSALNLALIGGTFDFGTKNGSLSIDATFASLADYRLQLSAAGAGGDISIGNGTPLTAQTIDLRATGSISGGGNSADLTATLGSIFLSANLGIGDATTSLSVETTDPAGSVRATTVTGDVFLNSPASLRLNLVTTGAGTQQIHVDAKDGIDIIAASATSVDDDWTLTSTAGDLQFSGRGSVVAHSFTADVAGTIINGISGLDVDTSATNGAISLTAAALGDATQPLALSLGTGSLTLLAHTGDIFVNIDGSSLHGNQIQNLEADGNGVQVGLTMLNGSLLLDNVSHFQVADDVVTLTALGSSSDIDFSGSGGALVAGQATLSADGSILSSGSAAVDLNTSAGNHPLVLMAGKSIGGATAPLVVLAGSGNVSAEADTGDIYVQSPGPLLVNHAIAAAGGKQISFATTGTNNPLQVSVDSLGTHGEQWHLKASGDITLRVADVAGIQFGQIVELGSTSAGKNILIDAVAGPITVDAVNSGVATADDNLTLLAENGEITSPGSGVLQAATLSLQATLGGIGNARSPVEFSSQRLITSSADAQWLDTTGTTRVALVQTTTAGQGITFSGGVFLLDAPSTSPAVQIVAGTLSVASNAVLGGGGIIAGNLHVMPTAALNLGLASQGSGRLSVLGDVAFDKGSTLFVDLNPPYTNAGRDYDQLSLTGNLQLDNPTLVLRGATALSTITQPIVLVDMVTLGAVRTGSFEPNAGSLATENGITRANVGLLHANLQVDARDGNDIILTQLSFLPGKPRPVLGVPPLRIPVLTRTDALPPVIQPPPLPPTTTTTPTIETESAPVSVRYIEVRIVVPIDEAGNVREEFAMKLPAEWLSNLPAILRRLPDDRYRIYLILEGGNEERQVLDVLVRNGRPVEPTDTNAEGLDSDVAESLPTPAPLPPALDQKIPAVQPLPGTTAPEVLREPLLLPSGNSATPTDGRGASRFYLSAGVAAAAIIASRQSSRPWAEEVDRAAAVIGRAGTSRAWRLWRFRTNRPSNGPQ